VVFTSVISLILRPPCFLSYLSSFDRLGGSSVLRLASYASLTARRPPPTHTLPSSSFAPTPSEGVDGTGGAGASHGEAPPRPRR
jgi:hypothetical protein